MQDRFDFWVHGEGPAQIHGWPQGTTESSRSEGCLLDFAIISVAGFNGVSGGGGARGSCLPASEFFWGMFLARHYFAIFSPRSGRGTSFFKVFSRVAWKISAYPFGSARRVPGFSPFSQLCFAVAGFDLCSSTPPPLKMCGAQLWDFLVNAFFQHRLEYLTKMTKIEWNQKIPTQKLVCICIGSSFATPLKFCCRASCIRSWVVSATAIRIWSCTGTWSHVTCWSTRRRVCWRSLTLGWLGALDFHEIPITLLWFVRSFLYYVHLFLCC